MKSTIYFISLAIIIALFTSTILASSTTLFGPYRACIPIPFVNVCEDTLNTPANNDLYKCQELPGYFGTEFRCLPKETITIQHTIAGSLYPLDSTTFNTYIDDILQFTFPTNYVDAKVFIAKLNGGNRIDLPSVGNNGNEFNVNVATGTSQHLFIDYATTNGGSKRNIIHAGKMLSQGTECVVLFKKLNQLDENVTATPNSNVDKCDAQTGEIKCKTGFTGPTCTTTV